MILTVPQDLAFYPTLGPQVCNFIEQNLVFGPGDLRGAPVVLDEEKRGLIWRLYEVYPQGHALAGRRRFKRCCISLPKGTAKTELAAWIAACELHPEAPVRCTGWTKRGEPIGGSVNDPYIPLVAYTEEQSDELAYTALRVMLEQGPLKDDFDIGLERILRKKGDGKAQSLSGSPNARDGARTTFQHFDETHRFTTPRLKDAHKTMVANIPKRKMADAWSLETTTASEPGVGSIAESAMEYAMAIHEGRGADSSLFYFHRQASDEHDLAKPDGVRAAVLEASGPTAAWRDIDSIVGLWSDPTNDKAYLERVYLNRMVKSSTQAFNVGLWKSLERDDVDVEPQSNITIGFDGGQFHDSTGLVCTDIDTGYQWVEGAWECPPGGEKWPTPWQVPVEEVDEAVRDLFERYRVWRMYADPPYWQSWVALWAGVFGKERVIEWWTNRNVQMSAALENYETAMKESRISHDGDARLTRHVGNARKHFLPQRNEKGEHLWVIRKERKDSPAKIDICMSSVLSWEARTDAIAAGVKKRGGVDLFFMGGTRAPAPR